MFLYSSLVAKATQAPKMSRDSDIYFPDIVKEEIEEEPEMNNNNNKLRVNEKHYNSVQSLQEQQLQAIERQKLQIEMAKKIKEEEDWKALVKKVGWGLAATAAMAIIKALPVWGWLTNALSNLFSSNNKKEQEENLIEQ